MSELSKFIFSTGKEEIISILSDERTVVITDENVYRLYSGNFPFGEKTIVIPAGEDSKSLETAEMIYGKLIELEAGRDTVIAGFGGGVICDIAGFIASTYKRGTGLLLVPTTLLAQADAAIGGKNGLNHEGFKNMIGCFKQPDTVITDVGFLKTLDPRNFSNGSAEVIKSALIADCELFCELEKKSMSGLGQDELSGIVERVAGIKFRIVEQDIYDNGIRKVLNFGHTVGHAIEALTGMMHGEAVSIGMIAECRMSAELTGSSDEITARLLSVLEKNSLPARIPDIDTEHLFEAVLQDKKRDGNRIEMVFIQNIGEVKTVKIEIEELKKVINDICKHIRT